MGLKVAQGLNFTPRTFYWDMNVNHTTTAPSPEAHKREVTRRPAEHA